MSESSEAPRLPLRLANDLAGFEPTLIRRIVDAAPSGAINLGLGQPVIAPPAPLAEAMAAAALRPASYSPNAGLPGLRSAIARHYDVSSEQVLVTAGAEQALFMAICGCAEPDDEILVPDPGFPAYELIAAWRGLRVVHYPLDAGAGFALDPQAVLERVRPGRTRLVVLNSPGNPTGTIFAEDALRTLLTELADLGVAWLSDEVYVALSDRPVPQPRKLAPDPDSGIVIDSLSKSHAAMGWRLGWLVAPAAIVRGLMPLQQMVVTCAPVPAQAAGIAAFSAEGQAAARAISAEMTQRRTLALEQLARIPGLCLPPPTEQPGAIYFFLDVSDWLGGDDVALCYALLEDGVILIPGQAFGARGRGWVRLSYGVEPDTLSEGIERLARGLDRLRGAADTASTGSPTDA